MFRLLFLACLPTSDYSSACDNLVATAIRGRDLYRGSLVKVGTTGAELQKLLGRPDHVVPERSKVSITYHVYYRSHGVVLVLAPWFGEREWSLPDGPIPPNARVTGVARFITTVK